MAAAMHHDSVRPPVPIVVRIMDSDVVTAAERVAIENRPMIVDNAEAPMMRKPMLLAVIAGNDDVAAAEGDE